MTPQTPALPDLTPASPAQLSLPACYGSVDVFRCRQPLSVDVEVARTLAALEHARGRRPTVVFEALRESSHAVVGNPYPRAVLLAALGTTEATYLAEIYRRLRLAHRPAVPDNHPDQPDGVAAPEPNGRRRRPGSLTELPLLRHRPGDVGRYLTAGILVSRHPDTRRINLGFYRALLAAPDELRVFVNPRADGHRNLRRWHETGRDMPIAIFLSADPVYAFLAAAGHVLPEVDDYQVAARLLGHAPALSGDPPVPASAPFVIRGRMTPELAPEGPFGEFKGFYTEAGTGYVIKVDSVEVCDAPMPFILPGAESGLALSGLEAEARLYCALTDEGFTVRSVRYPLDGHGKYLALVESDSPSQELIDAVLRLDRTPKMVLCGARLRQPWNEVGVWATDVRVQPYIRRGQPFGQRVGILVRTGSNDGRVEF